MRKIYSTQKLMRISLLAMVLMVFALPSSALVVPSSKEPVNGEKTTASSLENMNVKDFLALSPKKYKELTGEKLSLTQKISLKIAQKKIKKAVKNNEAVDSVTMQNALDTSDFNIGGFVLGLLLSVIGVLIAYLIGDTTVIKWAWIGFGVFMVIFLLTLIL